MHSFQGTSSIEDSNSSDDSSECVICGESEDEHWDHLDPPDEDDIKELRQQQRQIDK